MAEIYDIDGVDMRNTPWDGSPATENKPVSGRLVENYIKQIDDQSKPVDELGADIPQAPTSNAVFQAQIGMVTDVDVQDSPDGTQYVMTVQQRDPNGGTTPKEVRFSKYTDDSKVIINVDMTDAGGLILPTSQYLPQGSPFIVKYTLNVSTAGGDPVEDYSDLKARVIVKRGATVLEEFKEAPFVGVVAGQTYTFDATPYLKDATAYTVQVEAQAMQLENKLTKNVAARVTMVAMKMETTFNLSNGLEKGGYTNDVIIPFAVKGTSGEKNIYYRVNGGSPFAVNLTSGSSQQQRNVLVAASALQEGKNIIEAYAVHESSNVKSEYHYITVLKKAFGTKHYVGLMFHHRASDFQADYKNPVIEAEQFTAWNLSYAAYDAESAISTVQLLQNGVEVKEDSLSRNQAGHYGRTNVNTEIIGYKLVCGSDAVNIKVTTKSHADIEASLAPDAVCNFDAFGRSNSEKNANTWVSGDNFMKFENVLWHVNEYGAGSGWHNNVLLLAGGASMTLTGAKPFHPFNDSEKPLGQSIHDIGMTIEIEFRVDNVTHTDAELITCLGRLSNGNRYGLVVTPEEAKFLTGVVTEAKDGKDTITYEDAVGTKYQPGRNIRITYVFYPNDPNNEQRSLIGFYVNGEESAASKWLDKVQFDLQSELQFNSIGADLSIKNVRIYNKALSNDEVLNNYIVDRNHLEDTIEEVGVRTLDEDNRVLSEGDTVSMTKLMGFMNKRKNSILVLIGKGSVASDVPLPSETLNIMDALAIKNDKKASKMAQEVRFYNGENRNLDFIARDIYLRIQGTSSVNYARKNLRFYFQKSAEGHTPTMSYGEIDGNGEQSNPAVTESKSNKFRLRTNSVGAKLACAKCDYSDSSMTTNTGGAKFINDGFKEMGILTPAQRYAAEHPDTCGLDIRSAIDGMACDLFVAASASDDLIYYGQYNMNNEKSDSYPIFGQDDTIGIENWGEGDTLNYLEADENGQKQYLPICIETLNNSNYCCLFHYVPSSEPEHKAFMDAHFDAGFEFNYPKDVFFNKSKLKEGEVNIAGYPDGQQPTHIGTGDTYDKMYKAIDRMMSFFFRCVKETEAGRNMKYNSVDGVFENIDYDDVNGKFPAAKWKSPTFAAEIGKYFDVANILAYYLYVQYNLAVDQLAKNMLLRTWDGVKWYITYYDGDCQLGSDNKSFLSGKYDDNRETIRNGSYVMQGHNSWLWNLVLANLSDKLNGINREGRKALGKFTGAPFVSAFSVDKAIFHFDEDEMKRWCSRLYNKSGVFKYVYPFLNPMPMEGGASQTYAQIYGLKGSLKEHRNYFINRRYDLKRVEYGYISTDGAQFYQSNASNDAAHALAPLSFMLTIPYRIQITMSNGEVTDSGVVEANKLHVLKWNTHYGENDPLKIIGAEKIREMTWHDDAFASGFNMGRFLSLTKLDMSVPRASGYRNNSYMVATENMALLEELNMENNLLARNVDGVTAVLDLSRQSRLKKVNLKGTALTKLELATGAPLVQLALPETLEELDLEYLPDLAPSGLTIAGKSHIAGYKFDNCPLLDGFALLEELHELKRTGGGQLDRFFITIDKEDDGTLLEKYYNYHTYQPNGMVDNYHSGLRGKLRLTKYMEEEALARYRDRYPELVISQPEYTMIEFDDTVADDANISNLDNGTGYKYSNQYVPSGHINAILRQRHRVLMKVTKKPSVLRGVEIAGGNYDVNDARDGEAIFYPLHDEDSNFYADNANKEKCTPAKLDGSEGDWMMYEPHCWTKGINDYLNKKHYSCFSSNKERPSSAPCTVITLEQIESAGDLTKGKKIQVGKPDLQSSFAADSNYAVCRVKVDNFKKVRFPTVPGSSLVGSIFVSKDGEIVENVSAASLSQGFEAGMYIISDVPLRAAYLHFTILQAADFDKVVLSNSTRIEDMEPEWVEHEPYLCGVVGSSIVGEELKACITGGSTAASMTWADFHFYSFKRGMQQIDPLMHNWIANLSYAKYGRRDIQMQCGAGSHTNSRITGGTAILGMQDTVNTDGHTVGGVEGNGLAFYKTLGPDGSVVFKRINNINDLGYEDIYGHKYDFMDRGDVPNVPNKSGAWRIFAPDGSIRWVRGKTANGEWITGVAHGLHMDMVPIGKSNGSSSTYYCDTYWISTVSGRVLLRGYDYANASGGVAFADAGYDASYANANCGSRLAFRGVLRTAQSVAAFKAAPAAK